MNYGWFLDGIYKCWIFFRYVFIVLVVAFVLGGINDLFVDLYYWGRQLYRQIFKKKLIKPLTLDQLLKVEEKPVALIIPAGMKPVLSKICFLTPSILLISSLFYFCWSLS
jgi:hypothetical protein